MNNIFKFYNSTKWQQWQNDFFTELLELIRADSFDLVVQKAQEIIAVKLSNKPRIHASIASCPAQNSPQAEYTVDPQANMDYFGRELGTIRAALDLSDQLSADHVQTIKKMIQKFLPQQYDKANFYFKIYQNIFDLNLTNYIDLTLPIFALFVAQEELRHKAEASFNPAFAESLVNSSEISNIFRFLLGSWIVITIKDKFQDRFYFNTKNYSPNPAVLLDHCFKNINASFDSYLVLIKAMKGFVELSFFDRAQFLNFSMSENYSTNFIRSLQLINIYISIEQKCSEHIIKSYEQQDQEFYKKCNNFFNIINEQLNYDYFFLYSELLFKLYAILCYRQHRCFFRYGYEVSNMISHAQLNLLQLHINYVSASRVLRTVIPVLESLINELIDELLDSDNFIAETQLLQERIVLIDSKIYEITYIMEMVHAQDKLIRTELLIMELSLINNNAAPVANVREYLPKLSAILFQLTAIELDDLKKILELHQFFITTLINSENYYNLGKDVLDQMMSKITQYCQSPQQYKGKKDIVKYYLSIAQLLLEGLAKGCNEITQTIINDIDYFWTLGRDEQKACLNLIDLLSKFNQSGEAQELVGEILRSTQKVSAQAQMSIVYWLLNGVIDLLNKLWRACGGKQLLQPINTGSDLATNVEEFLNFSGARAVSRSLSPLNSRRLSMSIDNQPEFNFSAFAQFLDANLSARRNNFINSRNLIKCIDLATIYKKCCYILNKNRDQNNEFYEKCYNFYNKINKELTGKYFHIYSNLLHKLYDIMLYRQHQSVLIYAISDGFYHTQLRLLELQIEHLAAADVLLPVIKILELLINNFMHTIAETRYDNFVTVIDSSEASFIKLIDSKIDDIRCIMEIVNDKERLISIELLIMELSLINNNAAPVANVREYLPKLSESLFQLKAIELDDLKQVLELHQVVVTTLINSEDYYNLGKDVLDQMMSKITQYCQNSQKYKGNKDIVKYHLSRAQLLLEGLAKGCNEITQTIINDIDYFWTLGRDEQKACLNLIDLLSKFNQSGEAQELVGEILCGTQKVSAKAQMSIVYWLLNGVIDLLNKLWRVCGGQQLLQPINTGSDLATNVEEFLNFSGACAASRSLSSLDARKLSTSDTQVTVELDVFRELSRSNSLSMSRNSASC